jgi:hypothetical protein
MRSIRCALGRHNRIAGDLWQPYVCSRCGTRWTLVTLHGVFDSHRYQWVQQP